VFERAVAGRVNLDPRTGFDHARPSRPSATSSRRAQRDAVVKRSTHDSIGARRHSLMQKAAQKGRRRLARSPEQSLHWHPTLHATLHSVTRRVPATGYYHIPESENAGEPTIAKKPRSSPLGRAAEPSEPQTAWPLRSDSGCCARRRWGVLLAGICSYDQLPGAHPGHRQRP